MNDIEPANITQLLGIRIVTLPIPHRMVRAKTHRRARIDKKWLKRYGYKSVVAPYDPFEVFMLGSTAYAYPEGIEMIKQEIDAREQERQLTQGTSATVSALSSASAGTQPPLTLEGLRKTMDELLEQFPEMGRPSFDPWAIRPLSMEPIKPPKFGADQAPKVWSVLTATTQADLTKQRNTRQ